MPAPDQLLLLGKKKNLKLGLELRKNLRRIPRRYGHICVGFFLTAQKVPQLAPTRPLGLLEIMYNTTRSWDKQNDSANLTVRPM